MDLVPDITFKKMKVVSGSKSIFKIEGRPRIWFLILPSFFEGNTRYQIRRLFGRYQINFHFLNLLDLQRSLRLNRRLISHEPSNHRQHFTPRRLLVRWPQSHEHTRFVTCRAHMRHTRRDEKLFVCGRCGQSNEFKNASGQNRACQHGRHVASRHRQRQTIGADKFNA